ncbi:Pesticin receptor [Zhongshania aliphaticivorans]|uniref:Pesticin receptor n=1 Tax=Zhongshania aliphaticivorans TaxID=1470434 RepID=A0A5S9NPG4_9GAMM|nr:TonB-dependent receptor [Zhongshania aliphaticivorans]CAA0092304.1 Pesticin receptor [Zhongshania aliphaticivorans]CAA0109520.1 Pesticin receptor [Zhongshania aliphaticivorans]
MKKTLVLSILLASSQAWTDVVEKKRRDYIEEVIVTAQKRSQSAQDVPLSVSVMSAERMQTSAIKSFDEVALTSPNTDINMTPGYVQVGMRGLNAPLNDGMEQSVGFYVDGIYYGKAAFLQDAFLDLARVELLKGPQGTLFGKNTVAGAINVTSANPTHEWESSVAITTGDYDNKEISAMLNAPLIEEKLALRIAATSHTKDGYVYNSVRNEDEKQIDKQGIRAKLLFDATDDLSFVLTMYQGEAKDNGQGWEPFSLAPEAALVHGLFDPTLEDNFDYVSHSDTENYSASESRVINLDTNWEFGDQLLTIIASHAELTETLYLDADTGPAPIADWDRQTEYDQQMLEIRLTSAPGKIEYIVGAFGFQSDNHLVGDLRMLPDPSLTGVLLDALSPTLTNLLGPVTDPLGNILDPLLYGLTSDSLHQVFQQNTSTLALFTQLSWHISDRLTAIIGLRASKETKEIDLDQDYENTGVLLQAGFGVTEYTLQDKRNESNVAPKLSLQYAVKDDQMLYASYSEGFKAGGYNPLARTPDEAEFDQETAIAYELGYKITALEGALTANTALFYTQFSDMQIQAFIGNGFLVSNAAEATTKGLEFDINYQPFRGTMLYASAGYTDARFDDYPDGPCQAGSSEETCDLSGEQLPRAPEYSAAFGFNSALPIIEDKLAFVIGADYSWRDDIFFDLDQDPIDTQEAYSLVNLHVGIVDPNENWRFMVHVKNLEDKTVRQFTADLPILEGSHMGFLMPPRMITAEFGANF